MTGSISVVGTALVVPVPLITSIVVNNGAFTLTRTTVSKVMYKVQYKNNLGDTTRTTSASNAVASGTIASISDSAKTRRDFIV